MVITSVPGDSYSRKLLISCDIYNSCLFIVSLIKKYKANNQQELFVFPVANDIPLFIITIQSKRGWMGCPSCFFFHSFLAGYYSLFLVFFVHYSVMLIFFVHYSFFFILVLLFFILIFSVYFFIRISPIIHHSINPITRPL